MKDNIVRLKRRDCCETCIHWVDDEMEDKICRNRSKIGEYADTHNAADALTYSYSEGGVFSPGPKFGCVHHEEKR